MIVVRFIPCSCSVLIINIIIFVFIRRTWFVNFSNKYNHKNYPHNNPCDNSNFYLSEISRTSVFFSNILNKMKINPTRSTRIATMGSSMILFSLLSDFFDFQGIIAKFSDSGYKRRQPVRLLICRYLFNKLLNDTKDFINSHQLK